MDDVAGDVGPRPRLGTPLLVGAARAGLRPLPDGPPPRGASLAAADEDVPAQPSLLAEGGGGAESPARSGALRLGEMQRVRVPVLAALRGVVPPGGVIDSGVGGGGCLAEATP